MKINPQNCRKWIGSVFAAMAFWVLSGKIPSAEPEAAAVYAPIEGPYDASPKPAADKSQLRDVNDAEMRLKAVGEVKANWEASYFKEALPNVPAMLTTNVAIDGVQHKVLVDTGNENLVVDSSTIDERSLTLLAESSLSSQGRVYGSKVFTDFRLN